MNLHQLILTNCYVLAILFSLQVKAQNIEVSNGMIFDGEPYLAIDPNNSNHLVVAWMGQQVNQKITIKSSYSTNGGITWSTPIFQTHEAVGNSSADVSLAYDNAGNLFMAYIDFDNVGFTNGGVYVRKSTNGGQSWGAAVEAISTNDCPNQLCVDRPWIAVDHSSGPYSGAIYVTSMNADQPTLITPPYHPYLAVSINGGSSFNAPRFLDTLNYYSGSVITQPMPSPHVSSTGEFMAIYPGYEPVNQGPFAHLYIAKSSNAGATITHVDAYSGLGNTIADPYVKRGSLFRIDPSNPNHLAFFFLSETNGDCDIYFIESFNGGISWTSQQRINQDPIGNGNVQDLVWADFDTDGDLAVCWRDRRNGAAGTYLTSSEIYGVVRQNGGSNFGAEFLISDALAAHAPVLEGSGNDFMHVKFLNDTLYAVWGDTRNGVLSIYINKTAVQNGTNTIATVSQEEIPFIVFPNPTENKLYTSFNMNGEFRIIDSNGKTALEGNIPKDGIDVRMLTPGIYEFATSCFGKKYSTSFIKK